MNLQNHIETEDFGFFFPYLDQVLMLSKEDRVGKRMPPCDFGKWNRAWISACSKIGISSTNGDTFKEINVFARHQTHDRIEFLKAVKAFKEDPSKCIYQGNYSPDFESICFLENVIVDRTNFVYRFFEFLDEHRIAEHVTKLLARGQFGGFFGRYAREYAAEFTKQHGGEFVVRSKQVILREPRKLSAAIDAAVNGLMISDIVEVDCPTSELQAIRIHLRNKKENAVPFIENSRVYLKRKKDSVRETIKTAIESAKTNGEHLLVGFFDKIDYVRVVVAGSGVSVSAKGNDVSLYFGEKKTLKGTILKAIEDAFENGSTVLPGLSNKINYIRNEASGKGVFISCKGEDVVISADRKESMTEMIESACAQAVAEDVVIKLGLPLAKLNYVRQRISNLNLSGECFAKVEGGQISIYPVSSRRLSDGIGFAIAALDEGNVNQILMDGGVYNDLEKPAIYASAYGRAAKTLTRLRRSKMMEVYKQSGYIGVRRKTDTEIKNAN